MITHRMAPWLQILEELIDIRSIFKNLFSHRELIASLSMRDFQARFRGSFGGVLWSILQPLFLMVVYTLVFSGFLKIRFGTDDSLFQFSVYLLSGLLPWNSFSDILNHSTTIIRTNPNFVKRVVFPLEILPVNLVIVATIQQLIGVLLLLPLAIIVADANGANLIVLPIILVLQFLLFTGISWLWTSLSTFFPDLRLITGLILTAFIFLTPIMYPKDIVPSWAIPIVQLNPLTHLIDLYRSVFLGQPFPKVETILVFSFFCLVVFLLGNLWYNRTKHAFADVL